MLANAMQPSRRHNGSGKVSRGDVAFWFEFDMRGSHVVGAELLVDDILQQVPWLTGLAAWAEPYIGYFLY